MKYLNLSPVTVDHYLHCFQAQAQYRDTLAQRINEQWDRGEPEDPPLSALPSSAQFFRLEIEPQRKQISLSFVKLDRN